MALPNEQNIKPENRSSQEGALAVKTASSFWKRMLLSVGRSVLAVLLAIVAGAVIIICTTDGPFDYRVEHALDAYLVLFNAAFGEPRYFSSTLLKAYPLIFTGLSVAIAYRGGLFNIGAAGQMAVGGTAAGAVAFLNPQLPAPILIPLMILVSLICSGLWGAIAGFLKAWRGAHEVVTTIMLNWIAFKITDYLIGTPFKAPDLSSQTPSLPENARFPLLADFYNQTLGQVLGVIPNPQMYLVDVGILFALIALLFYWFLIKRTTFGSEVDIVGQNPKAARYAGINLKSKQIWVMALAGMFAGLAGSLRLMGQRPYYLIGNGVSSFDPVGFDGIGVAMLGQGTAMGILLSALLFGALRWGSVQMQVRSGVPGDLVYILQALILLSIAINYAPILNWFKKTFFKSKGLPQVTVATSAGPMPVDVVEAEPPAPLSSSAPPEENKPDNSPADTPPPAQKEDEH